MYEITVSGMTCGGCAKSINSALTSIDPTAKVSVDVRTQTVRVESQLPQDQIASAIEESGFPVLATKELA